MNDFTKLLHRQAQQAQADIDAILAKGDGAMSLRDATPGGKSPDGISGGGRVTGVVRWFSSQLGYGFIDQDGTDVYVHHSQIIMEGYRMLREGQVVEYTPVEGEKGPAAHRVEVKR